MKHSDKHILLLKILNELPSKMVLVHGREHMPHLVLHDICHESCFNFQKAAYFVDNPDFNCLKGVVGICKQEKNFCKGISDVWQEADKYETYMNISPFNQQVQQFECQSMKQCGSEDELIAQIAERFGFLEPRYMIWPMKHENNGILVFQADDGDQELIDEHLEHGVHYLSFCPVH